MTRIFIEDKRERKTKSCNCKKKSKLHMRRYIQSNFAYGKAVTV